MSESEIRVDTRRDRDRGEDLMKLGLATLSCLLALLTAGGAFARTDGKPAPGAPQSPRRDAATILVRFVDPSTAATKIAGLGDKAVGKVGAHVSIVRVKTASTVDARLAAYRARPDVVYAEPN